MTSDSKKKTTGGAGEVEAHRERELKLSCAEGFAEEALLAVLDGAGVTISKQTKLVNADVYYETRSASLAAAGLSGRCRNKQGKPRKVQLKPVPLIAELIFERTEIAAEVPEGREPGRALKALVERALPLKLRGIPVAQVELRNRRHRLDLEIAERGPGGGACTAELCLDRVSVHAPGARQAAGTFSEIELELAEGDELVFEALAGRLAELEGVEPSSLSKHQRARACLDLAPHRFGAPSPKFGPSSSADEVARAICSAQLKTISSYEPGTRAGLDPEHLHKMRVATRRLRAALTNFDGCFDRRSTEFLSRSFKWLAAVLGCVRDLDVHQMDLVNWQRELGREPVAGWQQLRAVLKRRWLAARRRMLAELDAPRYQRLIERAEAIFSRPAPRRRAGHPGAAPVVLLAEQMVNKRVRQFRKAVRRVRRTGTTASAHALRIVGKKLRYTAEFFRPLYPAAFRARTDKLKRFQDVLGTLNDATVAGELVQRLRDDALSSPDALPAYTFVLGRLLSWTDACAARAEASVDAAYREVGGNKLLSYLERTADAAARAADAAAAGDTVEPTGGADQQREALAGGSSKRRGKRRGRR